MQPCSQPRKALIERSKPMSGELLRVRIDLGCSIVTVVRRLGTPSSASTWSSQSPSSMRSFRLKRVGVELRVAPRPSFDSTGIARIYRAHRNITRTKLMLELRHPAREGWPAVLGHRLQGRRVLVVEALINPHVPKYRR